MMAGLIPAISHGHFCEQRHLNFFAYSLNRLPAHERLLPVTLKVKSYEAVVMAQREAAAQLVLDHFGDRLPPSRLLCFLDDDDPPTLRGERGAANRGLYGPIHDNTPMADWPDYVTNCIFVDDGISLPFPRVIDDLVYLYGSTCANEVGLTMTLAHELQHAIQHANVRKVWAINGLVPQLHDGDRP